MLYPPAHLSTKRMTETYGVLSLIVHLLYLHRLLTMFGGMAMSNPGLHIEDVCLSIFYH